MRKFTQWMFLCLLSATTVNAQQIPFCDQPAREQQLREQYPQILIEEQKFQDFISQWIEANKDNAAVREDEVYIIPIVFHIIHDYGTENISDDQVLDALRIINEDFRKLNADTSVIIDDFKDIAADSHIEFRLANKTPGGLCTNGIEHIHSLTTYNGGESAKLNPWPRSMYLNIWVVKTLPAGIGGYAYLPSTVAIPFLAPYDGVIILSTFIGSIGTGTPHYSRALTHEIGHSFGLNHPWGANNSNDVECGDDGIDDTPITKGSKTEVCNLNLSVCTPGVIENVQNYMDYSYCSVMYTEGQATVMNGTLNATSAERNNLSTESNLIATGTEDLSEPVCLPRIDFYPSFRMICTGGSITFHDVSWGGEVTSREWNFGDGNPATSTDEDPVVTFSTPGWKAITLSVTNAAGTATETREQFIYVSEDQGMHPVGFLEGFEDPAVVANEYVIQNREGNESAWQHNPNVGYYSTSSVYLNNYENMVGDIDNLITPSFDISVGGPAYLNFRISCASRSSNAEFIDDALKIYSSTDCGKTWGLRSTISGVALANAGYFVGSFVPNSAAQWVGKSILLPSAVYDSNVRFRFEYTTNGDGNNVYIDNINVSAFPVGVNDPDAASFDLNVFPNPVMASSVVSVSLKLSGDVTVKVVDQMGRIISVLHSGFLTEGTHEFGLNPALGTPGLYFLVVDDGVSQRREKIVVQ
jgi:PKD repeat protein